ncbi:glycoside hydrolase family 6 protein [Cellulomonas fimi]|uniref:Glucanase n=1 Tax=Cellulomonas fimi TaxID=1708 RepID=A0A7Y0QJ62_CELFI|nr:glycoside hydrolase family 6 protein [Cellulomonas fimi]NMR21017.1 glycoside hydrolase family 6 protein [Cellulomonas fimi]
MSPPTADQPSRPRSPAARPVGAGRPTPWSRLTTLAVVLGACVLVAVALGVGSWLGSRSDDRSGGRATGGDTTAPTGAPGEPPVEAPASSYLREAPPYVNPDSPAARAARIARAEGRDDDAALLEKAAAQGSARWLTTADHPDDVEQAVRDYAGAARAAGRTPVLVTYAIPDRDCGSESAGGFGASDYRTWAEGVARGLAGARAVVVVEPDSLLQVYRCGDADERFALLRETSARYAAAGAEVYLDAGSSNSFGHAPDATADMAQRLERAGVRDVAGFVTNVSNFQTSDDERAYGHALAALLDGARFVVDTSRNGNGPLRDDDGVVWCNPPGRALGDPPRVLDDGAHVADLWIKTVGLSDGRCNGGPPAGRYWEDHLLELARNAAW